MELKRAKEVLEGMNLWRITKQELISRRDAEHYVCVLLEWNSELKGPFTADQHEAIATWMRDPEGVVKA